MSVPVEVDELEKRIGAFETELVRRRGRATIIRREIDDGLMVMARCRESRDLCFKNLKKIKSLNVVPINDYRDMVKLYEDNCDLIIQHQTYVMNRTNELNALEKEIIPFIENSLVDARQKLSKWGVVIPFKK